MLSSCQVCCCLPSLESEVSLHFWQVPSHHFALCTLLFALFTYHFCTFELFTFAHFNLSFVICTLNFALFTFALLNFSIFTYALFTVALFAFHFYYFHFHTLALWTFALWTYAVFTFALLTFQFALCALRFALCNFHFALLIGGGLSSLSQSTCSHHPIIAPRRPLTPSHQLVKSQLVKTFSPSPPSAQSIFMSWPLCRKFLSKSCLQGFFSINSSGHVNWGNFSFWE